MSQLSRYILLEKMGSSVLGAVYKARDNVTGSLVALKVLQLGLLDDVSGSEMDARLQRNFEAASRLQHPGIARVFEIRRDGRTALIATELVEGPPITSLAKTVTDSDLSQLVAATVQLLDALDFAHNQSLVHRDLKPSNVLMQEGRVKITDFGMVDLGARNRDDTGALVGETEYMAPEQFLSGTVDKRCDIHAVGTILYQLLTAKSPFRGDPNTASAMFKVLDFVPPPPSQIRSGLSTAFDRVVARALAKNPAQRFVNAREFRNELFEAYVALAGRPPPETLSAVGSKPQAAGPEAPRTTLIQSRPVPKASSPISNDQREAVRSSPDPDRSDARAEPLTPKTSESIAPLPLNAKPAVFPPAATLRETDAGPGPSSKGQTAPAIPPPGAGLTDRKSAPLPGGTVLARPKFAVAAEPVPAPPEAVPTQPPPVHDGAGKAPLSGGTVLASPKVSADVRTPSNGGTRGPWVRDPLLAVPVNPPLPGNGPADLSREVSAQSLPSPSPSPAPSPSAPPPPADVRVAPPQPAPLREAGSAPLGVPRPRAAPLTPKQVIPLTDESITYGGRVLAQFIGPIAIVFSRRAAEAAHDERGYFDLLAAHLTDPAERGQFLRQLRQRHV
jgi:serine/threonine protein kinase